MQVPLHIVGDSVTHGNGLGIRQWEELRKVWAGAAGDSCDIGQSGGKKWWRAAKLSRVLSGAIGTGTTGVMYRAGALAVSEPHGAMCPLVMALTPPPCKNPCVFVCFCVFLFGGCSYWEDLLIQCTQPQAFGENVAQSNVHNTSHYSYCYADIKAAREEDEAVVNECLPPLVYATQKSQINTVPTHTVAWTGL